MAKRRLRSLSIFLLKSEVDDWEDTLEYEGSVARHETTAGSGIEGLLVAKASPGKAPWWRDYVSGSIKRASQLPALRNASSSGVLLLKAGDRRFAITFGYGRYLLNLDMVEHDFGLRVVLNTVDPALIRSVDARTIDDLPMQTQRSAGVGSSFEDFGLDVSRDLVRAVSGPSRDPSLGQTIAGADRLAISTTAEPQELTGLCRKLFQRYESGEYRQRYPWVDKLRPVKERKLIEELDEGLLEDLKARRLDNIHLAPPETVEPLRLAGFRFSTTKRDDLDPDPKISRYLESLRDISKLNVKRLKRDKVEAYEAEGEQLLGSWRVYSCLIYEKARGAALYVLSAGRWFQVSGDFQTEIIDKIKALPSLQVSLPQAPTGISEPDYNVKAANEVGLLNLDRQLVPVSGQRGGIELCDLLSKDRQLIHVKRRGASSTLSHLFSQGVVSATLLVSDPSFRAAAQDVVRGLDSTFCDALPVDRPEPASDYEISYVVITRGTPQNQNPLTLPFFSLVNLSLAVDQLSAYGFAVSVAQVDET